MRNKKSIVIISIILLGVMEMISCTHSPENLQVSFNRDIIPIFTASCALNSNCHLGANGVNQGVDLDSADAYISIVTKELVSIGNPTSSLLYTEVYATASYAEMPKPPAAPLSAKQQALILNWIKQGALNN